MELKIKLNNMQIIKTRKIWFTIAGILALASILALITWGLKPSIDFTGGTLWELSFIERPDNVAIENALQEFNLGTLTIQPVGDQGVIIKSKELNENLHSQIFDKLIKNFEGVSEVRFESVGSLIGKELRNKAVYSILLVLLAIIAYIAYAFRQVSKPVQSWKYGVISVVMLLHDILIVAGIFAFLGHYYNVEIDLTFVAALLTILGFSVNNTIIVFDRTRENLYKLEGSFEEIVNKSVLQSIARSVNTSLTVLLTLGAIYLFGGESIKHFSLALIIGVAIGMFSSIFITSPLLVEWYRLGKSS
ncbi:MAG: protein translocase subunit SecF [Patescibacteria group bacterium]|nr:protein translocase subunit SecF [Patescibacteria group bacterium]MDD5490515.1 protein translocase subunit SecF [Patescibacteria group bacterium]